MNILFMFTTCGLLLAGVYVGGAAENPMPRDPGIDGQFCRMMSDHVSGYGMPMDRWTAESIIKRKVGCDALYLYGMLDNGGWKQTPDDYVKNVLGTVVSNKLSFFVVYSCPSLETEAVQRITKAIRADAKRFSQWPGFRGFCLDEPSARPVYTPEFLAEFKAWLFARYTSAQLTEIGLAPLTKVGSVIVSAPISGHEKPGTPPLEVVLPTDYASNPVLYMEFEEFVCERFISVLHGMDSALHEVKPDGLFCPVFSFMSLLHMPLRSSLALGGRACSAISVDFYADGAPDETFWAQLMRNQARGPSFLTVTAGKYNSGPSAFARDLANGMVHSQAINIWAWCYAASSPPDYAGAGTTRFYQPGNYAVLAKLFERIDRIKPYLVPSASTARIALMYSEHESMWDQAGTVAWPRGGGFVGNCYGLHGALAQLGMACEPVFEELITRAELDRYDVVIIPGVTYLRPETVAVLKSWVADGGALIAMGPVGSKDRWGRPMGVSSIAGLTGVACRSVTGCNVLSFNGIIPYRSDVSASVLDLAGAQAIGHWTNGAVAVAVNMVGRGRVMSVGAEKFGWCYDAVDYVRIPRYNIPSARRFRPEVLAALQGMIRVAANGRETDWLLQQIHTSPDVGVTVRAQPGRYVMHLINYGSVTNAQVDLRLPPKTEGSLVAFYPADMSRAEMTVKGRDVCVTVRDFDVHEAVVIQYKGPFPLLKESCPGPVILDQH